MGLFRSFSSTVVGVLVSIVVQARGATALSPTMERCEQLQSADPDPLDASWSTCPDELGCVVMKKHESRSARECLNGLPDALFKGMFWDADDYALCSDIFSEPWFKQAISGVHPMGMKSALERMSKGEMSKVIAPDSTQLRMASVLNRLRFRWNWTTEHAQFAGHEVYGCCEPDGADGTATIYLYGGICDAKTIYDVSLRKLGPGLRFSLIAGHELGHIIDFESGQAYREPGGREMRATVYGSFFARCEARMFVRFFEREIADHESQPDQYSELRFCYLRRWQDFERSMAKQHAEWATTPGKAPEFTQFALACMAALPSDTTSTLSFDRCPSSQCSSDRMNSLMRKVELRLFSIEDAKALAACERDGPYDLGRRTLKELERNSIGIKDAADKGALGALSPALSAILNLFDPNGLLHYRMK